MYLIRVFLILLFASGFSYARYRVVSKNSLDVSSAKIEVVLPESASKIEHRASEILQEELLNIRSYLGCPTTERKSIRIYLKNTRALEKDLPIECLIERNKYSVRIGKTAITLKYPSSEKSLWIVGKFLRDFCRVMYLSPMPWGTEYSECTLKFKTGLYEFSPDYVASSFYDSKESVRWRILNGIDVNSQFFCFSHNLSRIFTRDLFEKEPEYFSFQRNQYGELKRTFWGQPDILNYRVQHYTAEKALKGLRDKKMFSIGINDSSYVDEREQYSKYKRGYFRGFPDWSNAIFEFSNLVAKKVSKSKPNAILGALAYMICENPPDFKIHKNIVPFYTVDRANYVVDSYAKNDFEILRRWGNSGCATFGIYEYMYGAPYLFPRDISKFSSLGISHAYDSGARFYFAETLSLWGYDASKMWLTARFIEDSASDYNSLKDFFFKKYYKCCANEMRRFFDLAYSVWENRSEPTYWLAFYKSENSLEKLNVLLLEKMSYILSQAQEKAKSSQDKNVQLRINEVSTLFDMTVSAYKFYISKLEFIDLLSSDADTNKLLQAFEKYSALKKSFLISLEKNYQMYGNLCRFKNLYEQEKFFPLETFIAKLNDRGEFTQKDNSTLYELSQTSEFFAITRLAKSSNFSYEVSKWDNFRRDFSVVERDFENAKIQAVRNEKGYSLAFENCELTGISRSFSASSRDAVAFSGNVSNSSSIGTLAYAGLLFLDKSKNVIKRKTFVFPNRTDVNFVLADICPNGTESVVITVFATKQKKNDLLLLKDISFRRQ